jgi:hypothetical protein
MTALDFILIYTSFGLAFTVHARWSSRPISIGSLALATVMVALWPFFASREILDGFVKAFSPSNKAESRKNKIRELLAQSIESERPGVSIVKAREHVDWYLELAEASFMTSESLKDGQIDQTPEITRFYGDNYSPVAALVLERGALKKLNKHLQPARTSLVDQMLNNKLLSPTEKLRRTSLLRELSELVGDHDGMSSELKLHTTPEGAEAADFIDVREEKAPA